MSPRRIRLLIVVGGGLILLVRWFPVPPPSTPPSTRNQDVSARIVPTPLPRTYPQWALLERPDLHFSIRYPQGSFVEVLPAPLAAAYGITLPSLAQVDIRIHDGEVPYDPFDPTVGQAVFQGVPQIFSQSTFLLSPEPAEAIHGYLVERVVAPDTRQQAAFFVGGGRTYEVVLTSQAEEVDANLFLFHTMLYSYQGPGRRDGDPTPTWAMNRAITPGPVLPEDQLLAQLRTDFGMDIHVVQMELVSEERARAIPSSSCLGLPGHPDAVWVATFTKLMEQGNAIILAAYNAQTGVYYCTSTIAVTPRPGTPTPPFVTAPPAPTSDPYATPDAVQTVYPSPRRRR